MRFRRLPLEGMKIAVASSGLGHVARGIETWAMSLADPLAERGVQVTLFGGAAPIERVSGFRCQVSGPESHSRACPIRVLPCLRRGDRAARRLAACSPAFAWRWGLTSAYGWEQLSFWRRLWGILRAEGFDILHVQDPMLACWCQAFRRAGLLRTRVVLAHGTEESPEFLRRFSHVQHLAPWHRQALLDANRSAGWTGKARHYDIPNFVDIETFRPATSVEKKAGRRELGIP